jgi:hypothetical protein
VVGGWASLSHVRVGRRVSGLVWVGAWVRGRVISHVLCTTSSSGWFGHVIVVSKCARRVTLSRGRLEWVIWQVSVGVSLSHFHHHHSPPPLTAIIASPSSSHHGHDHHHHHHCSWHRNYTAPGGEFVPATDEVQTPNLDSLVREGVNLNRAYVYKYVMSQGNCE